MFRLSFLLLLIGASTFAAGPAGSDWIVDFSKGAGSTEFHAIGRPSAIKVNGKGAAPRGSFTVSGTKVTGEATVDLNSFDTGIALRNTHMKEKYLQTKKYPEAKFTLTKMELPAAGMAAVFSKDGVPFEGKLQVHGQEKPVSGQAKIDKTAQSVSVLAKFSTKISDYKIETPGFAGITVADEVEVVIQETAPVEAAK